MLERRELLKLSIGGLISAFASGCRHLEPLCPEDSTWSSPGNDLTIDVHAHMFNGSDLQVQRFISLVAAKQPKGEWKGVVDVLGGVLQELAWNFAPSARKESHELRKISSKLKNCSAEESVRYFSDIRQEQYLVARSEMLEKRRIIGGNSELLSKLSATQRTGLQLIDNLPGDYISFESQLENGDLTVEAMLFKKSIPSAIDFVVEMFQYRFASLALYLQKNRTQERQIDLVLPALVDYDWWLNKGRRPASDIREQVSLMGEISALSGGRCHYWVPFCPYREAMYKKYPGRTFSSLELVQRAVNSGGAIGVKLYPPMGFAALGNAELGSYWKDAEWLDESARSATFGQELDTALRSLYDWCQEHDVPIMAHSNQSNGPSAIFEELAAPAHWADALVDFPNLRINLAHFAGANERNTPESVQSALKLVDRQQANCYVDGSYFSGLLDYPDQLRENIEILFDPPKIGDGILDRRFLYGSDWKMLAAERGSRKYLEKYQGMMQHMASDLRKPDMPVDFFGRNAVEFLGLRRGEQARVRLENFYSDKKLPAPEWFTKMVG